MMNKFKSFELPLRLEIMGLLWAILAVLSKIAGVTLLTYVSGIFAMAYFGAAVITTRKNSLYNRRLRESRAQSKSQSQSIDKKEPHDDNRQ